MGKQQINISKQETSIRKVFVAFLMVVGLSLFFIVGAMGLSRANDHKMVEGQPRNLGAQNHESMSASSFVRSVTSQQPVQYGLQPVPSTVTNPSTTSIRHQAQIKPERRFADRSPMHIREQSNAPGKSSKEDMASKRPREN